MWGEKKKLQGRRCRGHRVKSLRPMTTVNSMVKEVSVLVVLIMPKILLTSCLLLHFMRLPDAITSIMFT